ncbi:MAG: calcium-binding protein [Hyphomicrobiaceae bacterium]|nr:calcium-binding protein [Hyphomicrobiaceae bacterium]
MAVIRGTNVRDVFRGTPLNDSLFGLGGNDVINGLPGDDRIVGGTGNDRLLGSAGNDRLIGQAGNDTMFGGAGNDRLIGGDGNDVMRPDAGADFINGGNGLRDLVDYTGTQQGVELSLTNSFLASGGATGDTFSGVEDFRGTNFDDQVSGTTGSNFLLGAGGEDLLEGLDGNDRLNGGAADDRLKGGAGADVLIGGPGLDTFIYQDGLQADTGVGEGNRDVIMDFVQGEDLIDLSDIDANLSDGIDQEFALIGTAAFDDVASPNGEIRFDNDVVNNRTIIQVDVEDDGNVDPDFEIELVGIFVLVDGDFVL